MKLLYLSLSILGFIAPNILVVKESLETGNWMLWLDPTSTMNGMFANQISSAFIVDLLIVVFVFIIWSYFEAKKYSMKNVGWIWLLTFVFGMAGPFPLFLYLRECKREVAT